jgi:hypothetical protein
VHDDGAPVELFEGRAPALQAGHDEVGIGGGVDGEESGVDGLLAASWGGCRG